MIESETAKQMLAARRERRDMEKAGYELVGEGGGALWELHRGWRTRQRIVDVKIAYGGKELWVLVSPPPSSVV